MLTLILINCDTRNPSGTGTGGGTTEEVVEIHLDYPTLFKAPAGLQSFEIQAQALDDNGQGVDGVELEFSLIPGYGSIIYQNTETNAEGVQTVIYMVNLQQSIQENITCKVKDGETSVTQQLNINLLEEEIGSISITATPQVLHIGTSESISTTLFATVLDVNSNGISGLRVSFSSDLGTISNVDTTNNAGTVSASISFLNTEIPTNQNAISTWIKAYLGGGFEQDSVLVTVLRTTSNPDSMVVMADPGYLLVPEGTQGSSTIKALVLDANGNGVPGIEVKFIAVGGYINASAVTDTSGEALSTLQSLNIISDITATVVAYTTFSYMGGEYTISDTVTVEFAALNQTIGGIYVYADPPVITAQPGGVATTTIKAFVSDINSIAIPNLQVTFSCSLGQGALTPPSITDSSGLATATYYSNGFIGTAVVTAAVGQFSNSVPVQINSSGTGSIYMSTDEYLIYADGDVTYAEISAVLKNFNNEAIIGDTVHFSSSSIYSKIASLVVTDSTGTAKTIFDDVGAGCVADTDTSIVTARYDPLGLSTSLQLIIAPPPIVDTIIVTSTAEGGMLGNGVDTAHVYAYVYLSNDEPAPTGTRIEFDADKGNITPTDTIVQNGRAEALYVSPTSTGTDYIRAYWKEDNDVYGEIAVPLMAGNPYRIMHEGTDPDTLFVGGDPGIVYAMVQDSVGNGVPFKQVYWSTDLGTISSLSQTDSMGHTFAVLDPQVSAGVAMVVAKVPGLLDSLVVGVPIISGYPSSIQLSSSTDQLQVQGTGGIESASIIATVKDPNGNNVPDGVMVHFQLLPIVPTGAVFDNGTLMDSASTNSGIAQVSLNSGSDSGPVRVQAITWRDWFNLDTLIVGDDTLLVNSRDDPIDAEKSNIIIASGPPEYIDIGYSRDPQLIGESLLSIEVSARVQDIYGNNVSEGTAVFFSIGPDSQMSDWYGPTFALIDGTSTIQDTTGTAFTALQYGSQNTFSMVDIVAKCNRPDSTYAESVADSVTLPLFEGTLGLTASPQSYYFLTSASIGVIGCTATLRDGTSQYINNATIVFTNNLGLYFCCDSTSAAATTLPSNFYNSPPYYWRFIQYTGPNPMPDLSQSPNLHQTDGQAIMYMRAQENQSSSYPGVYTDPTAPIAMCAINAIVLQNPDVTSDPVSVQFNRTP